MATKKKSRMTTKKKKKKKWYTVLAPKLFGEKEVAHTIADEDSKIIGRVVRMPLKDVTGKIQDFDVSVFFRIVRVVGGDKAETIYYGQELMEDKVSRLVQKWKSRIDLIHDVTTTDGTVIRIKLLGVTTRRVTNSIKSSVRKEMLAGLEEWAKGKNLDALVSDILEKRLQTALAKRCSKIYPIHAMEVRKTEILKVPER